MESFLTPIARYTRFVNSTKKMLAVFAAVLAALVLLYPHLRKDSGVRIAFTSIEKDSPTSPTTMINARFHGLDKDNQPFNIAAKTATQIDKNQLGLSKIVGDIALNSGAWLSLAADTGTFLVKEKELDLQGSIEMFDDEGYEFRTDTMHVDVGRRTASTRTRVKGQGPLGRLDAHGGAKVDGNTKVIIFDGPVSVTVYPAQDDTRQPEMERK